MADALIQYEADQPLLHPDVGLLAPQATITAAELAASDAETARALRRVAGTRTRERQEARYGTELTAAVIAYLGFAEQHARLAAGVARAATVRAAGVGSARVGGGSMLSLQNRAAVAARAQIRHAHTDYEHSCAGLARDGHDDGLFQQIVADAQDAVDAFLKAHRDTSGP